MKVLCFVAEMGAVPTKVLAAVLGQSTRSAVRWANAMEAEGLVGKEPLFGGAEWWVWPTTRGAAAVGVEHRGRRPALHQLPHLREVARVRLHLQRKAAIAGYERIWLPEWQMIAELPDGAHRPDGAIFDVAVDRLTAVEVELTPKSPARLAANLTDLERHFQAVVYFADGAALRQLQRAAAEVRGDTRRWPKLAVRGLADVVVCGEEAS